MRKAIAPLPQASRDFDAIVGYYLAEAPDGVAERFVDALNAAYDLIARTPGGGSGQLGVACGLPNLRAWRLRGFPYVIFYVERPATIDIVRILHGQRDLPTELTSLTN